MLKKAKQYNFFTKIYNCVVNEINSLWGGVNKLENKVDNIKQVDVWWDNINKINNTVNCSTSCTINANTTFTINGAIYFNSSPSSINIVNTDIVLSNDKGYIRIGRILYNTGISFFTNHGIYFDLHNNSNLYINNNRENTTSRIRFSYSDFQTLRTMIDEYNSQHTQSS